MEIKFRKLENGLDTNKITLLAERPLRKVVENNKDYVLLEGELAVNSLKVINIMFKGVIVKSYGVLIPNEYVYL